MKHRAKTANRAGAATLACIALVGLAAPARSAVIEYSWPTPPKASPYMPGQLTFTQFNVCKANCGGPGWQERRERVRNVLTGVGADVVGLNEATGLFTAEGVSQWQDIINTNPEYSPVKSQEDLCKGKACTHGAKIMYRKDTVVEAPSSNGSPSSGTTGLGQIAEIGAGSAKRELTWAFLEAADGSTGTFLAISAHLPAGKDAASEKDRQAIAKGLNSWVDAKLAQSGYPRDLPVVLMADLNSYTKRQPHGAQAILTQSGWTDTWNAPERVNDRWSTINKTPTTSPWGTRPYWFGSTKNPVTRIDYILGRNITPLRYETNMWLNKDGTFKREYQASDHQSIQARIAL